MAEHIDGRRYGPLRNFMELYKGSDGTEQLWISVNSLTTLSYNIVTFVVR